MKDRVYTTLTLHRVIVIHKNKAKTKCLKTKQEGQIKVVEEVEASDWVRDPYECMNVVSDKHILSVNFYTVIYG